MSVVFYLANLQHGQYTSGSFNFSGQVTELATADIACVQERSTAETGWDASLASNGMAQAVYRENDPTTADGNAIWYKTSRVTILATYQVDLSEGAIGWNGSTNVDKSAVAAKVRVEGKTFYVVSTHLAWSAGADSDGSTFSAIRVAQATKLINWIQTTLLGGLDVVILGDMNFGPDYPKNPSGLQKDIFTGNGFVDLWNVGITEAKASAPWDDRDGVGGADMPVDDLLTRTHDSRRIDYCFLSSNAKNLSLNAIVLPDLRATCSGSLVAGGNFPHCPDVHVDQRWDFPDDFGVRPSDHNWIKLTLDIVANSRTVVTPSQFSWMPNVSLR